MKAENLTAQQLYNTYIAHVEGAPKAPTFRTWIGMGTKMAAIAGAGELIYASIIIKCSLWFTFTGSVYLLMIIAAKNLRIKMGKQPYHIIYAVCNAWRQPDRGECHNLSLAQDTKHRMLFISHRHRSGHL